MNQFAPPQQVNNKGKEPSKRTQGNRSKSRPINASVAHILHLQQTIGNQAVQRMIKSGELQLKDNRPQPGDVYTREADNLKQRIEKDFSNPLSQQKAPDPESQRGAKPTFSSPYQLTAMSYELPSMSNVETRSQTLPNHLIQRVKKGKKPRRVVRKNKATKALSVHAQKNNIGVARLAWGNNIIARSGAAGVPRVSRTTIAAWNTMLAKHNVIQATPLPPHNCAEAHLWLTLVENGKNPQKIDVWVVKVDKKNRTHKDSPCPNCQQWATKEFKSLNSE